MEIGKIVIFSINDVQKIKQLRSKMENKKIENISGFYKIIPLTAFRETQGVIFDYLSPSALPKIDSIDRIVHEANALSPGRVGDVERAWYMHPSQDDNLMVFHGVRYVDLYSPVYGKIVHFVVKRDEIKRDNEIIYSGGAMLVWSKGIFHRVVSGEDGSVSINFATHYDNFDLATNFNIYDLNEATGEYKMIRKGALDQY